MGLLSLKAGIDIGSKTIKGVIFDVSDNEAELSRPAMVYGVCKAHKGQPKSALGQLLNEMLDATGERRCAPTLTGSGAIGLAEATGARFVQEVVATKRSLELLAPQASAVIELGGEDAKVLYLTRPVQQRMNTSCAGGTGSYLEDVAALLGVDMQGLDQLARDGIARYLIASRCAVFALRDLRPLLANGADHADLAASAYRAVVDQTLGTLCAGRPLTGQVAFLGGPMEHLPHLVERFRATLGLDAEHGVKPEHAQLAAAMGAALLAECKAGDQVGLAEFAKRVATAELQTGELARLEPLVRCEAVAPQSEAPGFCHSERSERKRAESKNLADEGAGSQVRAPLHARQLDVSTPRLRAPLNMTEPETTEPPEGSNAPTAAAGGRIESDPYVKITDASEPKPLAATEQGGLEALPPTLRRREILSRAMDEAQLPLYAGVDAGSTTLKLAVIDSAGRLVFSRYNTSPQNSTSAVRAMWAELEEACRAAGIDPGNSIARVAACGYGEDMLVSSLGAQVIVTETTAHCRGALEVFPQASFILDIGGQDMKALWIKDGELADTALNETCSSGCGAFMSSAAAAMGLTLEELDAAALAAKHPVDLGARCTVFMRSRVRHAQEQQASETDIAAGAAYAVASNACHRLIGARRMGTLGDFVVVQGGAFASDAVLAAFEHELGRKVHRSEQGPLMGAIGAALIAKENAELSAQLRIDALQTCNERAQTEEELDEAPNVMAYQQQLLASYRGFAAPGTRGSVRVGLICALNDYEALPFWHACLRELGFSVVVPNDCPEEIAPSAIVATFASDMVCMPARLMHKRALQLAAAGATCILCPSSEEAGICPVTREYQEVLPGAMARAISTPIIVPKLGNFSPRAMNRELIDPEPLRSCLESLLPPGDVISTSELERAVRVGQAEYRSFAARVQGATQGALDWIHANPRRHGIVISGRSYHTDPELLGGIDKIVHEQGFAVLCPMGIGRQAREARRPFIDHTLDRRRTWIPAKHVLGYAALSVVDPQLDTIFLQSFGCGMDAVSHVDVERMLGQHGKPFTLVKLDSKADPKHTRLRVRALAEAIASRRRHELASMGTTESGNGKDAGTGDASSAKPAIGIAIARDYDDSIPKLPFEGLKACDAITAQETLPGDMCSTAALLAAYATRQAAAHPDMTIELPYVCEQCILESAQHFVTLAGHDNLVSWASDWPEASTAGKDASGEYTLSSEDKLRDTASHKRIGIAGNPLMLFDAVANQGLVEFICQQGVEVVFPELYSWYSDVAHYLPQLESLEGQGVEHVLLVQSFLCLKTHVYVRGAMPQFEASFPQMTFHVIDIDPQASALNVRNRVLLAINEL